VRTVVVIQTVADVTDECLAAADDVFVGWFADRQTVDWPKFFQELASVGYVIRQHDSSAHRRIYRHVRRLRGD